MINTEYTLTWDAPRFANAGTTYTIYTDTDPEGTFLTVLATGVSGTTWSGATLDAKKFYKITTD